MDAYPASLTAAYPLEGDSTVYLCVQGVVASNADIIPGVERSSSLAH
jgi:hypothetical protein